MNQSRQELLQGLYSIQNNLRQAGNARLRLQAIADKVLSEKQLIQAENPRTKFNQLMDSILIAAAIFGAISSFLTGRYFWGILYAGALFLSYKFFKPERYRDRVRRKKSAFKIFLYIIGAPFILMAFMPFVMMIAVLFGSPLRAAVSGALTVAVYTVISKKREQTNVEIVAYNEEARQINLLLQQEAAAVQNKLVYHAKEAQRIGAGWYPRDYYNLYAIGCFIQYIENYKADTVKEMVNLFEDSEHKRRMEQYQQESLNNQRAMQNQLNFMDLNNMMNTYLLQNTIRECAVDPVRAYKYNL